MPDISAETFAKELKSEPVVRKWNWSAFEDTELNGLLKKAGVTTVLGCGLVTSRCVHHTMFGAFNEGYRTILIQDCCGDRSKERHEAELFLHGNTMYEVYDVKDVEKLK